MTRNIKNIRIIKALLDNPAGMLSKYRLAKLSGSSIPWAIEFLKKLEEKKLIKNTKVLDYDGLVDYAIEAMPKQKYVEFFVRGPEQFLKTTKLEYALTTYVAENYLYHHLFPSRYDLYIKKDELERWKAFILKNGLFGKGNLRLILAADEALLKEAQTIKGLKFVSTPQLMIDLKKEGGVCMEGYTLIRKEQQLQEHVQKR